MKRKKYYTIDKIILKYKTWFGKLFGGWTYHWIMEYKILRPRNRESIIRRLNNNSKDSTYELFIGEQEGDYGKIIRKSNGRCGIHVMRVNSIVFVDIEDECRIYRLSDCDVEYTY